MKKISMMILIVMLLIISGCKPEPKPVIKTETKVIFLQKYGERIYTNGLGQVTEYFTFYSTNPSLKVNSVEFKTLLHGTLYQTFLNEILYDSGKFLMIGFDNDKQVEYKIKKIILNTDEGDYSVDVDLSSRKTETNEEIIKINDAASFFFDDTFEEDFNIPILLNVRKDKVNILDIKMINNTIHQPQV